MPDERSVDRTQLIIYVQVAMNVRIGIFELHLKRGQSISNVLARAMGAHL